VRPQVSSAPVNTAVLDVQLPGWDYADAYEVIVDDDRPESALAAIRCLSGPGPARLVLRTRNLLVSAVCLKPAATGAGELFPVLLDTPHLAVMTTLSPAHPPHARSAHRQTARVVGWLFLVTSITAISAKVLFYPPLFDNLGYIVNGTADGRLLWGVFSEVLLVIANIATAVLLFPLLKRQHEGLALGFVTARVVECVFICVGILSVLTIVTMRQDLSPGSAGLATVGHALATLHEWTFQLGPGFTVGVGNGLILGYLMYRSGLVPRGMALLGLAGGAGIVLSGAAVLFGLAEAGSPLQLIASIPEFFWELSLGIYLIAKGFKASELPATPADAR